MIHPNEESWLRENEERVHKALRVIESLALFDVDSVHVHEAAAIIRKAVRHAIEAQATIGRIRAETKNQLRMFDRE